MSRLFGVPMPHILARLFSSAIRSCSRHKRGNRMRTIIVVFLALALSACATSRGFNRDALRTSTASEKKTVTDDEIKKALALKPQLPAPFKLAVYFNSSHNGWWSWLGADRDRLIQMGEQLRGKQIISGMIVIGDDILEGNGTPAIRMAAARAGADAVLIVNGAHDLDRYNNPLGASYILFFPFFLLPGTQTDGLFMASASMWDVRNQYLYLSADAEGTASQTRPGFFIDEEQIIRAARAQAVDALANRVASELGSMARK